MAAYNFPNSPSDGDTVTSNGITYTYSSSKTRWDAAAPSGSSTTVYATIDLLPLSGASTGDQAFVSGNNRLYIWNGTGWYNIALINTTPSISGVNGSYALAADGTPTTVTITATDPEGLPITYSIASDTSGNIATVSQGTGANSNVFTITPSTNAGTFSLTFRASDGVNIATAVSSFTLQLQIDDSNYTTALITSVGANNATNSSFTDDSSSNHTITANGNVSQSTFSPHRHGGYSTLLDGNGDTLTVPSTSTVAFGTGAFTVEAWVYILSTGDRGIFQTGGSHFPTTASASSAIQITSSGTKWAMYANNTSYQSTVTYSLNRWYHVALVRGTNSYTTLYVDGTAVVGVADGANYSGTYLGIGAIYGAASAQCFNGYIRDFRVVKGTAVYTSAFTPPTEPLTAITNTSLLTCHLPYIADGSTNGHAITVNGNTNVKPYSPYDYNSYSEGSNGGSLIFDGNDDYLTITRSTDLNFGTDDFIVEAWVYMESNAGTSSASHTIYSDWPSNGARQVLLRVVESSGQKLQALCEDGSANITTLTGTSTFPLNQWKYVSVEKIGTTLTLRLDGSSEASATVSDTVGTPSANPSVGVQDVTALNADFDGHITDLRVRHAASLTAVSGIPTSPLTATNDTVLLLNGTDAAIIDKSQSVKTITLNGDVKSSTTQTKYLTSSMYFDGAGDFIDTDFPALGTGDFTIEFWMNQSTAGTSKLIDTRSSDANNPNFMTVNGEIRFLANGSYIDSAVSLSSGWYHVAATRNSGITALYVDGVRQGTFSDSKNYAAATLRLAQNSYATPTQNYHGYMSDVRITKGLPRYTAADETANIPSAALQG